MPTSTSLRGRVPGQALIGAIVTAQHGLPQRTRIQRILGANPLAPSMRGLYRAALGEVAVGEMLDQLGPRWDVLHVVPVSPAAADDHESLINHLVIGPPGVFALTTRNYPGQEVRVSGNTMIIGGDAVDDVCNARRLAQAAGDRLSEAARRTIVVEPIIVVIDSRKLLLRGQAPGAMVVTSKNLIRELVHLERSLAGSEIAYISDVAERATTWESAPSAPEGAIRLSHDFAELRTGVREAMQARIFWGVVGFAIVCAAAWAGTVLVVEQLLGS